MDYQITLSVQARVTMRIDDANNAADAERIARKRINDLGMPAVVGTFSGLHIEDDTWRVRTIRELYGNGRSRTEALCDEPCRDT